MPRRPTGKPLQPPGVYVEEVTSLPVIQPRETALPVFIGYTDKASREDTPLHLVATRIHSLAEYQTLFGGPPPQTVTLWLDAQQQVVEAKPDHAYTLYDSLQLFFANGGNVCMIVSVGVYGSEITHDALAQGLAVVAALPDPTLIVMPEAVATADHGVSLYAAALAQSATWPDRITICDLPLQTTSSGFKQAVAHFREGIGDQHLKSGAVYGPWLVASLPRQISLEQLTFRRHSDNAIIPRKTLAGTSGSAISPRLQLAGRDIPQLRMHPNTRQPLQSRLQKPDALSKIWIAKATTALNTLPPGGAMAGVYAVTDRDRGIWKAPANVALRMVSKPVLQLNEAQQAEYNIDAATGKSINLIRAFTGKGTLVWGGRTLAGNDNEWRYINVRRLFGWVEASVMQGLQPLAFEPNEAKTWTTARAMTEHFLTTLWRDGALMGSKPEQAFFVRVGLGQTMTTLDVNEGRMILEIGMAAVRPAEFSIIRCLMKMSA